MNNKELRDALGILIQHEDPKVVEAVSKVMVSVTKAFKDITTTMKISCTSMEDTNLILKYMAFDLEATRRERDKLRAKQ
jgi:hypothetical protein